MLTFVFIFSCHFNQPQSLTCFLESFSKQLDWFAFFPQSSYQFGNGDIFVARLGFGFACFWLDDVSVVRKSKRIRNLQ